MYEERMDTRRVAEDELWIQPVASSSTLPQTHEYSPNESTDPLNGLLSPSGSFQSSPNIPLSTPNGGTTASSTGLEGSKQIPWWLRESRRQSDAASVSSSIPPANSHTRLDQKSDLLSTSPILPLNKPVPYPTDTPAVSSPRHILQAAAKHLTNAQGSIRLPTNLSPKDRVLWSWINVEDLDTFLQDVRSSPSTVRGDSCQYRCIPFTSGKDSGQSPSQISSTSCIYIGHSQCKVLADPEALVQLASLSHLLLFCSAVSIILSYEILTA